MNCQLALAVEVRAKCGDVLEVDVRVVVEIGLSAIGLDDNVRALQTIQEPAKIGEIHETVVVQQCFDGSAFVPTGIGRALRPSGTAFLLAPSSISSL